MAKTKSVAMRIVGASETIPALVGGYAPRTCNGEAAIVLLPRSKRCVVVLVQGAQAFAWENTHGTVGDGPRVPTQPVTPAQAVALAKGAQTGEADVTKTEDRGEWKARMECGEGSPVVILERTTSSYAKIRVISNPANGQWQWEMARKGTWFGSEATRSGTSPWLITAIQAAFEASFKGAAEVCAVRDTKRRQSRDAAYAENHPITYRPEKPDKISGWEPKVPKPVKPPKPPKAEKPPRPPKAEKPPKPPKAERPPKAPKPEKPPKAGKPQSMADMVSGPTYPTGVDPRVARQIGYDGIPEPRPFPQSASPELGAADPRDAAMTQMLMAQFEKQFASMMGAQQ